MIRSEQTQHERQ